MSKHTHLTFLLQTLNTKWPIMTCNFTFYIQITNVPRVSSFSKSDTVFIGNILLLLSFHWANIHGYIQIKLHRNVSFFDVSLTFFTSPQTQLLTVIICFFFLESFTNISLESWISSRNKTGKAWSFVHKKVMALSRHWGVKGGQIFAKGCLLFHSLILLTFKRQTLNPRFCLRFRLVGSTMCLQDNCCPLQFYIFWFRC